VENRRAIEWSEAAWLNPPEAVHADGNDLVVTARKGSDFWRTTSYGFVHDDGHALLTDFPPETAIEVGFVAAFDELYDQAGVLVRVDAGNWIKAGVEFTDGVPHLGAVVTRELSDWSMAPVPEWAGREVTIRVSRSGDAVTVRARVDDEPWRMVRLAPLSPEAEAAAGAMCCAPTRSGLNVRFTSFAVTDADAELHAE
jgi:regulation of enolase protein 1 (concanavalin A-like superfamily)